MARRNRINAYGLFVRHHYNQRLQCGIDASIIPMYSELDETWRSLTTEEQNHWKNLAKYLRQSMRTSHTTINSRSEQEQHTANNHEHTEEENWEPSLQSNSLTNQESIIDTPHQTQESSKSSTTCEQDDLAAVCKICYSTVIQLAFIPCGHSVSCVSCAQRINNCPCCRKEITKKIRIYII